MLRRPDRSSRIDGRQWYLESSIRDESALGRTIVTWTEEFSDSGFCQSLVFESFHGFGSMYVRRDFGYLEVSRFRVVDVI